MRQILQLAAVATFSGSMICSNVQGSELEAQEIWPQFRGSQGTAIAHGQKVPVNLSKETLRWSINLPGPGSSSPVIWGDKLFITTENREKGLVELVCLDAMTGESRWSQPVQTGVYHLHNFNNLASGTPCVTEDRVVLGWYDAATEHAMLSAYTQDGDLIWTQDLGLFVSQHGVSLLPVASGDRVFVGNMHRGGGATAAYSLADGELLWSIPNPNGAKTAYVAPLVRDLEGTDAKEVVMVGELVGMMGLDFETGKTNWSLPAAFNHRTITSPIIVNEGLGSEDVLIAAGNKNGVYFAAKAPRLSDGKPVTESAKVWAMESRAPYVPTPVASEGVVYALHDGGTMTAMDAESGSVNWQGRLLGNFYASPVLVDDKLYCLSRDGEMWVVATGPEFKMLRKSSLNPPEDTDWFDSTPAVAHNRLYVRLGSRLDCY